MKRENIILIVSMILNFVVAVIKLISGLWFGVSSLIADSFHSLADFITDIISMIASKIGDKKANKRHPFGYGMVENIANLFIGFILIALALFILIRGFIVEPSEVNYLIFVVLFSTLLLKSLVVLLLYSNGKRLKNNMLLVSSRESSVDLISTIIVFFVSLMLLFKENVYIFNYADVIGSILISLIIIKIAFNIIKVNIDYLIGSTEENEEIYNKINDIISNNIVIKASNFKLMKIGDYYTLYLTIELDNNITLRKIMLLENKLKKLIKGRIKDIKFIQIEIKEFK